MDRYKIVPQMEIYDRLPVVLLPHITVGSRPHYRSKVVNTDSLGFRVNVNQNGSINNQGIDDRKIMLGSSYVFGVGATQDKYTLPALLNFKNLGVRAATSTQELIAAIPWLHSAEKIVWIGGANNLIVNIQTNAPESPFGPIFNEGLLEELSHYSIFSLVSLHGQTTPLEWVSYEDLIVELYNRAVRKARGYIFRQKDSEVPSILRHGRRDGMQRAVDLHRRDLRIIERSRRSTCRLLFVLQPIRVEGRTEEEKRLFDLSDEINSTQWPWINFCLSELWPEYSILMRQMCFEEGVDFVNLNDVSFEGWSYVDRVHMTNHGYSQVAARIGASL